MRRRRVLVDEGIAPLLEAAWAIGVRTEHSCQGTPHDADEKAYIVFADPESARLFTEAIGEVDH